MTPAPFLVAGIVNITPDSFSGSGSGAGRAPGKSACLARARRAVEQGAHIVDLGAESTRPGAEDIGWQEEWRRLAPVLAATLTYRQRLQRRGVSYAAGDWRDPEDPPFALSLDTFRARTAALALEFSLSSRSSPRMGEAEGSDAVPHEGRGPVKPGCCGLDIINDVSGFSFEPEMLAVVAQFKPGYVLGHSPARPAEMQKNPRYDDVADTLLAWFTARMDALVKAGLPEECICLDPCIGFGKNLEHTLDIIAAIPRFLALGRPLYFGISRKSFLGGITGREVRAREAATVAATALLGRAGVAVHRVHKVAGAVDALAVATAFGVVGHTGAKEAS